MLREENNLDNTKNVEDNEVMRVENGKIEK